MRATMRERVRKKFFDEADSIFEEVVRMKDKGLSLHDVAKDLKDYFLEAA